MIVIDAKDLIAGRVAAYAAKKALLGNQVAIVNCEAAVISGRRQHVLESFFQKRAQGTWATGPFYQRQPDRLLRRIVRGMLPYKKERGRNAYKQILCYLSVPQELKEHAKETPSGTHKAKLPHLKYVTLGEVSTLLGGKTQ
jgi:large subunit ribosomal protein L13